MSGPDGAESTDPQPSPLSVTDTPPSSGSSSGTQISVNISQFSISIVCFFQITIAGYRTTPKYGENEQLVADTKEISGEEALRRHLEESAQEEASAANREMLQQPTILGERTLSSGQASIAEVMHEEADVSPGNIPQESDPETRLDTDHGHEHELSTTVHGSDSESPALPEKVSTDGNSPHIDGQ